MTDRASLTRGFLAAHGWADAKRSRLAGDASFRRYERLSRADCRMVLMDAPPPQEDVRPFTAVARHLVALGYSAPKIEAEDTAAGFLLLEDLGDSTYSRTLNAGADAAMLYAAAIDLLADLRRHSAPAGLATYDETVYLAEADLLIDWFLPAVTGRETEAPVRATYHAAWRAVLSKASLGAPVLVLRDYHADNLMWLPERTGPARVGLLDFQDALAGSPAYDLVSLLEDVRRDVAQELVEAMIGRYLKSAPEIDAARFRDAYAVLGGQRNAKIVGIFTRLWLRDGKAGYLDLIPRAWRLLEHDLAQPALAPVRAWFDEHVPPALRRAPTP
jgi:aminoglycoside/choline kinase family phosphotransferase